MQGEYHAESIRFRDGAEITDIDINLNDNWLITLTGDPEYAPRKRDWYNINTVFCMMGVTKGHKIRPKIS